MEKCLLLAFTIFAISLMNAQEQAFKITNTISQKEVIIKENKRVKVTTLDGTKIKGRIQIKNNSIFIKDKQIDLNTITSIRKNPLVTSLLTTGIFVYAGTITAGIGIFIATFGNSSAVWLLVPAAGLIYAGIKPPNFNKNYKSSANWVYEIISLPQEKEVITKAATKT